MWIVGLACTNPAVTQDSAMDWGPDPHGPLPPPGPIELVVPAEVALGGTVDLIVRGAEPGESVRFALAGETGVGPCPVKLGGLCLDLVAPLRPVATVVADAYGVAVAKWPASRVDTACFQAVVRRGPLGADSVASAAACVAVLNDLDPEACGLGTCVDGHYMEGGDCLTPVGYADDALLSLLVCGGVLDPCCGLGTCTGGSYVDDCLAYAPTDPLSMVICGGAYEDGNGVGACVGGSWCDDAVCYVPGGDVSTVFCGCQEGPEVTEFCGPMDCVTYCDDCYCYAPDSPLVASACPGGTGAFRRYYTGAPYAHFVAANNAASGGFIAAGFSSGSAAVARFDARGDVLWRRNDSSGGWQDVTSQSNRHVLGGVGEVAELDDAGAVVWWSNLPNAGWIAEATAFTNDGGSVALATAGGDLYLAKWSGSGVPLWAETLGGVGAETALDVLELDGGDLLLFAATTSWGAGADDLLFARTDASGGLLWAVTLGGGLDESNWPVRSRMSPVSDGTVTFATTTRSWGWGGSEALYGKLDPDAVSLDFAWYYGWTGDEIASTLVERPDGRFWLFGEEFTDYNGFFVTDVAADGTPGLGWSWGEDPFTNYLEGGVAPDGSPWLASETHHHPEAMPDHLFYLVKGDPDGKLDHCCEVEPLLSPYPWPIFPALVPASPVVAGAALPAAGVDAGTFPALVTETLCDVDHTYVCGGPITSECLCTP